jgi:hypothetical protein
MKGRTERIAGDSELVRVALISPPHGEDDFFGESPGSEVLAEGCTAYRVEVLTSCTLVNRLSWKAHANHHCIFLQDNRRIKLIPIIRVPGTLRKETTRKA